jgi:arsenate reductase
MAFHEGFVCLDRIIFEHMKKIYYLGTCSTCADIMKDADISESTGFELQDIRTEKITPVQIDQMKKLAGSYEALFSRRALKYKELGLKDKKLTDNDYKNYILEHDTFLKRPVVILDDDIFIGSEKKNVAALKAALGK